MTPARRDAVWRAALTRSAILLGYGAASSPWTRSDVAYVVRNLVVGGALAADARRRGTPWAALGLDPQGLPRAWRWGSACAAATVTGVAAAATLGAGTAPGRALLSDRRAALARRELLRQVLLRIPVGTAAFEELAFRGVLLAAFEEAGGRPAAVGASSALFGLWHVAPTLAALRDNDVRSRRAPTIAAAVAVTGAAGVGLALLRYRAGHLLACALAHWGVNAAGLVAAATWRRRVDAARRTVYPRAVP